MHKFHIKGMHCHSCANTIEKMFKDIDGVLDAKSNFNKRVIEISLNTALINDINFLLENVNAKLKSLGYEIIKEKEYANNLKLHEVALGFLIAFVFIVGFIALSKSGFVNITMNNMTYSSIFLLGLIASVSTCMAVVGGLLLSFSGYVSMHQNKLFPHVIFHTVRLAAFFIFGGILGIIGQFFGLSYYSNLILNFLVSVIMLFMGFKLTDLLPINIIRIPVAFEMFYNNSKTFTVFTPIIFGLSTFFLPCGFTQSVQLYALSSASFIKGSLTMFIFALGTLPVLSAISLGMYNVAKNKYSGILYKTAGFIVIFLGIYLLINSLVLSGLIKPIINII